MRKLFKVLVIAIFVFAMTNMCFASSGEWVQEGKNWKYKKDNEFIYNKWEGIDGVNYHFDGDGNASTGICEIDGKYHAFKEDGKPYTSGESIEICGHNYKIGARGLITKLPSDFTLDSIKYYEESLAMDKESKEMSKKAYDENIAKLATMETTTTEAYNNNSPIGKIVPVEKDNSYVASAVAEYNIPEESIKKLMDKVNNSSSYVTAKRELEIEFANQLSFITLCLTKGNNQALAANIKNADVNNSELVFECAIAAYRKLASNLIDAMVVKYNLGSTGVDSVSSKLNEVITQNVKKFNKAMNED